jgi:hypothetical protein
MCHTRIHRYHPRERAPRPFDAPTPPRETGPVRVGDADRERVATLLRDHAAAGRLDADELGERIERAYGARYSTDLDAVLAELPREPEPRGAREPGHRRASAPDFSLLPVAIIALVALAAITGAWWLMWLIWPVVVVLGPRRHYRRGRI